MDRMRRTAFALTILGVLLLATSQAADLEKPATGYTIAAAEVDVPGLELRFDVLRKGTVYSLELAVTNTGDETTTFTFPTGKQFDFRVLVEEQKQWSFSWNRFYIQTETEQQLEPGESVRYVGEWSGLRNDGNPLSDSIVKAEAELCLSAEPITMSVYPVDLALLARLIECVEAKWRLDYYEALLDEVPLDDGAYGAMQELADEGLLQRYPAGYFDGSTPRTRGEFILAIRTMEDDPYARQMSDSASPKLLLSYLRVMFEVLPGERGE